MGFAMRTAFAMIGIFVLLGGAFGLELPGWCPGCEPKGNLPGISVEIPVYPKATAAKEAVRETVRSVPSGAKFKVHTVTVETEDDAEAVLEFYKDALPGVTISDLGSFYAVIYMPEGWTGQDRIEIDIFKKKEPGFAGYEIRQFREK